MKFSNNLFNFLVLLLLITGCSIEKEPQPQASDRPAIEAKVDNVLWTGSDFSAALNVSSDNYLSIVGMNNRGIVVTLVVPEVTGTGTFSTTASNQVSGKYENRTTGEYWTSNFGGSCTITITRFDKAASLVSGTFNFTAKDISKKSTKTVTDGIFTNLPITYF